MINGRRREIGRSQSVKFIRLNHWLRRYDGFIFGFWSYFCHIRVLFYVRILVVVVAAAAASAGVVAVGRSTIIIKPNNFYELHYQVYLFEPWKLSICSHTLEIRLKFCNDDVNF